MIFIFFKSIPVHYGLRGRVKRERITAESTDHYFIGRKKAFLFASSSLSIYSRYTIIPSWLRQRYSSILVSVYHSVHELNCLHVLPGLYIIFFHFFSLCGRNYFFHLYSQYRETISSNLCIHIYLKCFVVHRLSSSFFFLDAVFDHGWKRL